MTKLLMLAAATPLLVFAVPARALPAAPIEAVAPQNLTVEVQMRRRMTRQRMMRSRGMRRAGPRFGTDGNARRPAQAINQREPLSQRGSGQQSGGPARALIPSR